MLAWAVILLLSVAGKALCAESAENGKNDTSKVSNAEETSEGFAQPVPESLPADVVDATPPVETPASPTFRVQGSSRPQRRRPRRPRGYYNDIRYRNPANNPYNPNSPYAFRGRPGQPPFAPRQQAYSDPYYDPYNQYYGYHGYAPIQAVQQQYYPYPYQPQARPQAQQTPPPTETIPDLYYVQKADSPDGHYQYKKVSVVPDSYLENRGRRRPTRWSQHYHPAGAYYNYAYDPYERRPPPPQAQQNYYQQYPYPQQYPPYYQYPRVAGGPRSRLRSGRPPVRSTASPGDWRLTLAPFTTLSPVTEPYLPTDTTDDQPSGD